MAWWVFFAGVSDHLWGFKPQKVKNKFVSTSFSLKYLPFNSKKKKSKKKMNNFFWFFFFSEKLFFSKIGFSECLLDKLWKSKTWENVFGGWKRQRKVKTLTRKWIVWPNTKLVVVLSIVVLVPFFFVHIFFLPT